MSKTQSDYAFRVELPLSFEQAVERVTTALQTEGFGVLTEIDVKATLKKKLNAEFRKYTILGACNPPLAQRALQEELEIGLLLPCNIIVYETDDGSTVSIIDPIAMMSFVENPELDTVASEASTRLQRVIASL
jgi:uncharacterized protein (DUF302 family)